MKLKLALLAGIMAGAVLCPHHDAKAQSSTNAPCIGVGGINTTPQFGIFCNTEPNVATYSAISIALAPAASATDIACLTGSATKVVRLKKVRISGTAGTAINTNVIITKHTVADTGGTAATGTALPVPYTFDTFNVSPTATTTAYTANPTINDASPGFIEARGLLLPASGTAAAASDGLFYYDEGVVAQQPPVLRGVAQQLCVNLNGVTVSTGAVNIGFTWTEQAQ